MQAEAKRVEFEDGKKVNALNPLPYPHVIYDMLPRNKKNPSFIVQFDISSALPRFLIIHRAIRQHYFELTTREKYNLLEAAHSMIEAGIFGQGTLSIPLDDPKHPVSLQHFGHLLGVARFPIIQNFTCVLTVPDAMKYLGFFKRNQSLIPTWPGARWITERFIEDIDIDQDKKFFEKSIFKCLKSPAFMTSELISTEKMQLTHAIFHQPEKPETIKTFKVEPVKVVKEDELVSYVAAENQKPALEYNLTDYLNFMESVNENIYAKFRKPLFSEEKELGEILETEEASDQYNKGCVLCLNLGASFKIKNLEDNEQPIISLVRTTNDCPKEWLPSSAAGKIRRKH